MIDLHYYPATAAMVPHILLEELGAPYRLIFVDRTVGAHKEPEYLKLNPNGLIPVLVDGDLVLYETAAICMHLCDTHPQAGLAAPLGTAERAHFYKWMTWLTNTLQATLLVYFYPERWAREGDAAAIAEVKAIAERKVGAMLDQLDAQVAGSGGPWFAGAQYSAVDAFVLTLCRWTRNIASPPARTRPHLGPYLQRMLGRPAVQRAFEQEKIQPPLV
jgi:glutathione S-transferase